MREVLGRADEVVGGGRDRRRRHRRRDLPVRPATRRRVDAGRPRRHRRRLGLRRLRRGCGLRAGPVGGRVGRARAAAVRRLRRRRVRGRAHLRRHPRRVRREGGPADLPRARRDRRRHRGRPTRRAGDGDRASGPGVAGSPARRTPEESGRIARQRARRPTRSPTTRSACSSRGTARPSPTDPTASAAARGCGSSSGRSRRRRGCSSSAPSTSRPRWPGSARSSATTSPSATRGPSSPPTRGSRTPTRSWSSGRTSTSPRRSRPGRIDGRTVICVLTHDPKFDVPVLEMALRLPEVAYVGAMGSRRTHDDRLARLREAGVTEEELARLSSPIGLDLGARTPEETAVSIAAEIIAGRWGGTGDRLSATAGRIHAHAAPASRAADHGRGRSLPAPDGHAARRGRLGGRLRVQRDRAGRPPRAAVAVDDLHRLGRRPGPGLAGRSSEGDRFDPAAATSYDVMVAGLHPVAAMVEQPAEQAGVQLALHPLAAQALLGCRPASCRCGRPRSRGARSGGRELHDRVGAAGPGRLARRGAGMGACRSGRRPAYLRATGGGRGLAGGRPPRAGAGSRTSPEVLLSPRQLRTLMDRRDRPVAEAAVPVSSGSTAWSRGSPRGPHPRRGRRGDAVMPTRATSPASSGRWRGAPRRSGWPRSAETSKTGGTATGQNDRHDRDWHD